MRGPLVPIVAWLMAEPGHVRLRDRLAWWATTRLPLVARVRGWRAGRRERLGFRAWDR